MTTLVETWRCLGTWVIGVGQMPCDAHGQAHKDGEKHLKATGHSVVLTATTAPATTTRAVGADA